MFRGRIAALLALLAALLLVAPGAAAAKQKPRPAFPVTIKAANGNVTITKRPTRIVSLSPTTTEDLYAVGAGRQVVAVDELSNYPSRAPRTKLSGYTPNVEAIAGYRPDLVIVRSEAGVAQLRRLGITVLQLKEAGDLAQAYAQVLQVGRATGHTGQATAVVRWMRKQITAELRTIQGRPRQLSVYHELTTDFYSATSSTFIGRVYKLLGLQEHRGRGDRGRAVPAALRGVHRRREPGCDRARRLQVLRPEPHDGRRTARLGHDRRGAQPARGRDGRRHRLALGAADRGVRSRRRCAGAADLVVHRRTGQ